MKLTTENFFQYLLENHEDLSRINVFPHKQETLLERQGSDINISRYVLAEILNQKTSQYRSYVFDSMRWNAFGKVEKMLGIDVFYYQHPSACAEGHQWLDTLGAVVFSFPYKDAPNFGEAEIPHKRFCKRCGKDWADR